MSPLSDRALSRLRERAAGPVLGGERYVLEREIGHGGMGHVWLATDEVMGRIVAVKVLDDEIARPELESRMRHEARILARLEHPGIVPVHDLGRTVEGRLFYVMKHVQGETLAAHLAHVADRAERLRIFERLCDPVAFAHSRGVVHRDLKPDNVMVGSFGEVLVMDWGVAKVLGVAPDPEEQPGGSAEPGAQAPSEAGGGSSAPTPTRVATDPGTVLGTRGFMAPEQERGGPVDARADVYALGAILKLMLDGNVPRPLVAICAKAMAPAPADRYADAGELAEDVARHRDGLPVSAYRESVLDRTARWGRKYQAALLLIGAYLVMRGVVALWIRQRT